jgi:hypothetical protein
MENSILFNKLAALPEHLKTKVAEFIDSLLSKETRFSDSNEKKPVFGSAKGMFVMKPGFDEPLEDFKEYMH